MKSCSSKIVKLSAKAREALTPDPPTVGKESEIENLILHLTNLLNSWDEDKGEMELPQADNDLQPGQSESLHKEDPIVLLATKINSVNARNYDQSVCTTQFDTEEPETYAQAMQGPNTTQ